MHSLKPNLNGSLNSVSACLQVESCKLIPFQSTIVLEENNDEMYIENGEVEYSQQPDAVVDPDHCLLCISTPKGNLTLAA